MFKIIINLTLLILLSSRGNYDLTNAIKSAIHSAYFFVNPVFDLYMTIALNIYPPFRTGPLL